MARWPRHRASPNLKCLHLSQICHKTKYLEVKLNFHRQIAICVCHKPVPRQIHNDKCVCHKPVPQQIHNDKYALLFTTVPQYKNHSPENAVNHQFGFHRSVFLKYYLDKNLPLISVVSTIVIMVVRHWFARTDERLAPIEEALRRMDENEARWARKLLNFFISITH